VRVGQTDKRDEDQEAEWVEKVNNRNKATVGFSGLNKHATWAGKKKQVHRPSPTQLDSFFWPKASGNDQQLGAALLQGTLSNVLPQTNSSNSHV